MHIQGDSGSQESTSNSTVNTASTKGRPFHVENDAAVKASFNHTSIENLPNELLSNIISYLELPPPSASLSALYDEPTFELTQSSIADLKSVSYVSKRWRTAASPVLFRHAQLTIQDTRGSYLSLYDQLSEFIAFIRAIHVKVTSLTLLVHDKKIAKRFWDGVTGFWDLLFDTVDPAKLLIVAPPEALGTLSSCRVALEDVWCFDCPCQYLSLERRPPLLSRVSDVKNTAGAIESPSGSRSFSPVESISLTTLLPGSPGSLALEGSNSSALNEPSPSRGQASKNSRPKSSPLLDVRPWTKLLLNEGSFIRMYATYEFWLRQPPSILGDLVGHETPPQHALISPTIRDLSYIGIFPMSSHFSSLTRHIPRLDRVYVQLVPRNDIMQNPQKMTQVEAQDLWSERNSCYALFMRELFSSPPVGNYKYLQVFESGDAADRDAWNMAVEFVKRANNKWRVAEDGVFVRDVEEPAPSSEGEDGGESNPSSLSVNPATNPL